jgi:hypothetical protein
MDVCSIPFLSAVSNGATELFNVTVIHDNIDC